MVFSLIVYACMEKVCELVGSCVLKKQSCPIWYTIAELCRIKTRHDVSDTL